MNIELSSKLKIMYPRVIFGSLIAKGVPNMKQCKALEQQKRELEKSIREFKGDWGEDDTIQSYNNYFRKWGKTYPIELQIKTIKKGGKFAQTSLLVDSMFMAELKNRILTSGHDVKILQGDLIFDVSEGGEQYLMLSGKEQELKKNDVILRDEKGILASILYGPAKRTSITPSTKNVLYLAWCPNWIDKESIISHLDDILSNLNIAFVPVTSEIKIHR